MGDEASATPDPEPTIEMTVAQLNEKVEALVAHQLTLIDNVEGRQNQTEQLCSQIVLAYAEVAANVEAILSILANDTKDARIELQSALAEHRIKMMEVIKSATRGG